MKPFETALRCLRLCRSLPSDCARFGKLISGWFTWGIGAFVSKKPKLPHNLRSGSSQVVKTVIKRWLDMLFALSSVRKEVVYCRVGSLVSILPWPAGEGIIPQPAFIYHTHVPPLMAEAPIQLDFGTRQAVSQAHSRRACQLRMTLRRSLTTTTELLFIPNVANADPNTSTDCNGCLPFRH